MSDDYTFNVKRKRPEEIYNNVIDYYKGENLLKYAKSKSMMRAQERLTIRALEIVKPKPNSLILDVGCGPGFSTIFLKQSGYKTVALDIISSFLTFYNIKEENPINANMVYLPFF